jgi:hypothetical protein
MGQLPIPPGVHVADLQHINQMKTAEGYSFKQEYKVHAWFCLALPSSPHWILT